MTREARRNAVGAYAVVLALLLVLPGCSKSMAPPPPPPIESGAIPPAHGGETAAPTIDRQHDGHGAIPGDGQSAAGGAADPGDIISTAGPRPERPVLPSPRPSAPHDTARPPATGDASPPSPLPEPSGTTLALCPATEEMLTLAECAAVSAPAKIGAGAFNSPDHMQRGESVPVRLVIDRDATSAEPAAEVEALPGATVRIAPHVGRYMKAELTSIDGAFRIEAKAEAQQDLFAADQAKWEWNVTALNKGEHVLTLTTQVLQKMPDGSFKPRSAPKPEDHAIIIDVSTGQWLSDFIDASIIWLGKAENLAKAAAAALAALLALWALLRKRGG